MSISESPVEIPAVRYVQWGSIVAGAVAAAALAFVLNSFAVAVGLSVSSTAPTWRDTSFLLVFISGLYLILVAIAAYSLGGYIAGRLRERLGVSGPDEAEFRDGCHGLAMWGLATLLIGVLAFGAISAVTRTTASPSVANGPVTSAGDERIIAYDLDRLFRGERSQQGIEYARAEAGRILLTAASRKGVQADDRTYLIRMVAARTGLAEPEATRRVDDVIKRAHENITRARRSATILAFMVAAAALLGAAMAWFAACAGGHHRDTAIAPAWMWRTRIFFARVQ